MTSADRYGLAGVAVVSGVLFLVLGLTIGTRLQTSEQDRDVAVQLWQGEKLRTLVDSLRREGIQVAGAVGRQCFAVVGE